MSKAKTKGPTLPKKPKPSKDPNKVVHTPPGIIKEDQGNKDGMKTGKPTQARPKTGRCLRQIDATTQLVCDDEYFPPVQKTESEKVPKGCVRVDESTIVKAPKLGKKKSTISPGAQKK